MSDHKPTETTDTRPLGSVQFGDSDWLEWFYSRVTDQYVLARESFHNTHQWTITLTLGLVTAVVALGGQGAQYPTELSVIAVLAAIPFLFRFFVRSCLEYSIHHRWATIRDALDLHFYLCSTQPSMTSQSLAYLQETIRLYYFQWLCPRPFSKIVGDNLRLAYSWPFILLAALTLWGIVELPLTPLLGIALAGVGFFMVYEIWAFVTYRGFKFEKTQTPKPEAVQL